MLKWYKYLYIGDNAKKNIEKYKRYLNRGEFVPDVYLITLASNQADQLDIIRSYYLLQDTLYRRCPLIVGVAKGQQEAQNLLLHMVEETYAKTGTANVKEYLMQR